MFSSGGPSVRFLARYDVEVSEPLVGRQGSRVSMRVARGSAVSNPYQTFLGPTGVYTWSGLSGQYQPVPASVPLVPSHTRTHTLTVGPWALRVC